MLEVNMDYHTVALVNCETLDDAFKLTNTIDDYWWKNECVVQKFSGQGCRSTSVGDIIENAQTREHWICAPVGWEKLNLSYEVEVEHG